MLRIKIELWPGGRLEGAREIARMDVFNDGTGTKKRGNYGFRIYNKTLRHVMREGRVENYPRLSYSVWVLIKRVLNEAFK